MYIICILLSLLLLVITLRPKKKLRNRSRLKLLEVLNKKLSKIHLKDGSKNYNKLHQKIINAGVNLSPETFQTMRIILPIFTMMFYIAFNVLNYINLKLNTKGLLKAAEILNDETILNIALNIDVLKITLIGAITMLFPDVLLRLMVKIQFGKVKRESLILQTYTIMLLKTSKPVKQILISLYERASYFKPLFKTANEKFSSNPDEALLDLKKSAPQGDFLNICIALQQALNGDRKLSLIYLENHRKLAREVNKQIRIRNQTRNQGIGILIMMIPLLVSLVIVGYPWLIYVIKTINSIPI